jgi:hypothetical protein
MAVSQASARFDFFFKLRIIKNIQKGFVIFGKEGEYKNLGQK